MDSDGRWLPPSSTLCSAKWPGWRSGSPSTTTTEWRSTRRCLYSLGLDEADIDGMRKGHAPSENTAAATHQLAREVVLARGKVSDATITGATEAGLDIEAILEIVLEVTFAGLVGTIDDLANHVELDDFLAPRAWER